MTPNQRPIAPFHRITLAAFGIMAIVACYTVRPGQGGGNLSDRGKAPLDGTRKINPADIALPKGYRIEAVAYGLTFPTGVAFDDKGQVFVLEGGYAYGERWDTARILQVLPNNLFVPVAVGDSNGPWTGMTYGPDPDHPGGKRGAFYVAEGGQLHGGRILKVTPAGKKTALAEGMPSYGDHHTNGPAIGPDSMLYFSQGTATNSGVVGLDNRGFGWMERFPAFHDIPCQDITLTGVNYKTVNPFPTAGGKAGNKVETGAFSPYGTPSTAGQVVKGEIPCNGAVMRIPLRGGKPELVAWGFRNPFALGFSKDGRLYVIDNGYDQRGSRPIWGAAELLWEVQRGVWYGWPDYSGSKTLSRSEFTPPHEERPAPLLQFPPGPPPAGTAEASTSGQVNASNHPPEPSAYFPVHSSADGLDFSRSAAFGHEGEAFVALFGDMAPSVGKVLEPVGFKIVRVDAATGIHEDFAVNRDGNGPASKLKSGGLERPVAVRFSPDGKSLYVVDFGVMAVSKFGPVPGKQTGVLWRIWKEDQAGAEGNP